MDEDKIKEISAKVFHDKIKDIKDEMYKNIKSEIISSIFRGEIDLTIIKDFDEFLFLKKRIIKDCEVHMAGIFREMYAKMMTSIKMTPN